MNRNELSYTSLLAQARYLKAETPVEEIEVLLQQIKNLSLSFTSFYPSFFILDYTRKKYKLLALPIIKEMGYHEQDMLEGGLDFVIDKYHPDDFITYNEQIFLTIGAFLKETPAENHSNFLFSSNFRVRTKTGKYAQLLQKARYITDKNTGLPVYSYGSIFNITPFKTDNSIVHVIEEHIHDKDAERLKTISLNHFFPDAEESVLTAKEREVLCWIVEGLSTKEIATKLNISVNTVFNHRRNMFRKTNSKNVADIIRYAIKNRIV